MDHRAAALAQAQAQLQACQQQLMRAERMAALGPVVAKATQTLIPLLTQAQQTASELHAQNEQVQQGLLHSVPQAELQQEADRLDKIAMALAQQLQGLGPVLTNLRHAVTDPMREIPRPFRLHDLAAQVLAQLPGSARREGVHMANGIPRDIELTTRASACAQVLGQLLTHTVAQAFEGREDGILRLSAKAQRQDDGTDAVVLSLTDNGAHHGLLLPEHTQRALVQSALGGTVAHQTDEDNNVCTLTIPQYLEAPGTPTATTPTAPTT
jgi:C4-dicarboxylate-specific signal transduction histidine kinase